MGDIGEIELLGALDAIELEVHVINGAA
jgi:hypothetical protein